MMKVFSPSIIFLMLAANQPNSYAQTSPDFYAYGPATIECVIEASKRQKVPANVLLALASMESGKNGQFVKNTNGSLDIGHFQINTIHFGARGHFKNLPITQKDVAWRGCYNAELAAWLLAKSLNDPAASHQDFWTRAANYHSKTPKYNTIYKNKLVPFAVQWGEWLQKKEQQVSVSYQ